MNTPNSNIILGVAGNERDAQVIYQTAATLGESVFDATVVKLDEDTQQDTTAAVRNRIRDMYFPEGIKTFVIVAQKVVEEVRSAIEDLGATVIELNGQTSPEYVMTHIRELMDMQTVSGQASALTTPVKNGIMFA